ncbi:MAG: Do family serine endopeptidase, partial [Flavobacteriales bacterium]
GLFLVGILGGVAAISCYKAFEQPVVKEVIREAQPVKYFSAPSVVGTNLDFTLAAEKTVNAVVHVKTESTVNPNYANPWMDFFGMESGPQVQKGSGSGVIISSDGYIVTNNHVIEGAQTIEVSMNNNKNYTAEIIGADPATDIALLKIQEKGLPSVDYGNSDDLKIGQWVLAVGNPFDLTSTVTAGIVSAKARNINLLRPDVNKDIFPIESFIQTDAAVNPGNSGGALVNTNGELVGINTAIASKTGSYSGYSFAVPASIVKKIAGDLKEFGMVQRAFIGVQINDVNESLANEIGLNDIKGVFVAGVVEDGAAAEAGIEKGDVILKVGKRNVNNVPQLQEEVSRYRPGDQVSVNVWRDGKLKDLTLTLKNSNNSTDIVEAAASVDNLLGAELASIESDLAENLGIHGGVQVNQMTSGPLLGSGMSPSFIITKVDGQKVYDPEGLNKLLSKKNGGVLLEGIYPNGKRAYYGLGL